MKRFASAQFALAPVERLGRVQPHPDPCREHLTRVLKFVDAAKIRRARMKVAIDCCNGAGARVLPELLGRLGCDAEVIFAADGANPSDGSPNRPAPAAAKVFPRVAEPLPEHLGALSKAVKRHGAAVGFAVDPDADRLALVDEMGRPIGEERTITLAANHLLERMRSPVVVNLSTTRAVEDVCAAHGVRCHRTKIGEAHVVGGMRRHRSRLGGEGNGGVILGDVHQGRDSLGGIAVILEALARNRCALSELNARVPDYAIVKDKVPIGRLKVDAIYHKARREFAEAVRINDEDGLRLDFGVAWLHLRPSGTEPIFRVFAEAPEAGEARALVRRVHAMMK